MLAQQALPKRRVDAPQLVEEATAKLALLRIERRERSARNARLVVVGVLLLPLALQLLPKPLS